MKNKPLKNYVFWITVTVFVGFIAGLITRQGTKLYNETVVKPPLSPPAIVFPIVWTVLYALMGYCAARVSLAFPSKNRKNAIYVYSLQLVFNFFWSLIFFNAEAFLFAFIWLVILWGIILATILIFRRVDRLAGNLLIPYLIWVTFALYLNFGVFLMNR
jgi:tryptophan-rich sensory protein